MLNLEFLKANWRWILLIWFNAISTIGGVAFAWLTEWGTGFILYASLIIFAALLLFWRQSPDVANAQAVINLTDQAIEIRGDDCICKYCGINNPWLRDYPFDPRFHYGTCMVSPSRMRANPRAITLAPPDLFVEYDEALSEEC